MSRRTDQDRPLPPEPDPLTCPQCGLTTWHPADIAQGYCTNCHAWTSLPAGARAELGLGLHADAVAALVKAMTRASRGMALAEPVTPMTSSWDERIARRYLTDLAVHGWALHRVEPLRPGPSIPDPTMTP